MQWTMGEITSADLLYDAGDAKPGSPVWKKLAAEVMANVLGQHYFTEFWHNKEKVKFGNLPPEYGLSRSNHQAVLTFVLPLAHPQPLKGQTYRFSTFDPTYFVDMSYGHDEDVHLPQELASSFCSGGDAGMSIITVTAPVRRWGHLWPLVLFILLAAAGLYALWIYWPQILLSSAGWQRSINQELSGLLRQVAEDPSRAGLSLLSFSFAYARPGRKTAGGRKRLAGQADDCPVDGNAPLFWRDYGVTVQQGYRGLQLGRAVCAGDGGGHLDHHFRFGTAGAQLPCAGSSLKREPGACAVAAGRLVYARAGGGHYPDSGRADYVAERAADGERHSAFLNGRLTRHKKIPSP
ncbi:hypothetical protein BBAD15_g349 [Beauveria bassiana D1-5]|uniref:Uncharacterized protein n=1 Tax=Beauveria bassiana D1-5 TaxID=1245745 RepID=A0A0A2W1F1_BEABA|nr:hypothetical protein BBAD15_g349 [Beauveria bassiana D1-5]